MEVQSAVQSKVLIGILLEALVFGMPGLCMTQEEEEPLRLEELVITGTKRARKLKDVPVRTEVLTSKDIEDKGAITLYDALMGVPGIRVEQQCSACNFSILRMQGMSSGHVQILIDGQPIFTGLAGVYGLQQIQAGNIERIEIVKGAGSALYGSDAIAGVVNIIMKKPEPEPLTKIGFNLETNKTSRFNISTSQRKENFAMRATLQKSSIGEINANPDVDYLTDRVSTDNVGGGVKVYWYDIFGNDRLLLSGRLLNEMRKGGDLRTWDNPFAEGAEHIKTARTEAGVGYKKTFSQENELDMNFTYSHHSRNATNDAALEGLLGETWTGFTADSLPIPFVADEDIINVDVNYSHPIGGYTILAGIQYRRSNFVQRIGEPYQADIGWYGGRTTTTKQADDIGIYLQGELPVMENLEIVVGGRGDLHNSLEHYRSGDVRYNPPLSFNPRVAVRYSPMKALDIRGSVGTGFRVPYHFDEDLHLCSGSPMILKPLGLNPESSLSITAGAEFTTEGGYYISLNGFRTDVKGKIEPVVTTQPGYDLEWKNGPNAYSQGIEIGAGGPLVKDLEIAFDYTFTNAERAESPYATYDEETWQGTWAEETGDSATIGPQRWNKYKNLGKYIPRVAAHNAGIGIAYSPGTWNLHLGMRYHGSLYIEYLAQDDHLAEIKTTDPYFTCNIKACKTFGNIACLAGVKNLTGYIQPDKRPDDAAFMWAPYTGREFYGGVELTF